MMQNRFDNTICAPATSRGGAVSVIRVSGMNAIRCVDKFFRGRKPLAEAGGYTMHFGRIVDSDGALLDEVVVSVFRAPHSYTGENAVEIACHGSDYIVSRILSLLLSNGAKMASPGEFTRRAFLHGKMDLSQAEAVADLIAAQTAAAHRIALKQLKGGFSEELAGMRAELLHLASLMELELDFSEEEVEFADRKQLRELVGNVTAHCDRLIESFRLGNAIKNGVPVAIVGNTNVGKSTLLNALLGEERAIVSDIAGTTRDTIEETFNIDGVLFRFIDTAGLRESEDSIERIGIGRAYEKLSSAQLVLAVLDLAAPVPEIVASAEEISSHLSTDQRIVFLLNKADAVPVVTTTAARKALSHLLATQGRQLLIISARDRIGLEELRNSLSETYRDMDAGAETTLVTNLRHVEALRNASASLRRVQEGLDSPTPVPTDLLAQDLREALYHLGSIVGEVSTDEILGNIFRNFCIGK
ncbi:MAG: tRNA uridine-5-carboxymethylaminomethyl(34) synthesis GTPase MnmE [Bacteroidales bacterium]|nr:tRNA uridine-5-carboxymethylaminomethyl(34) synthesis GTPase MnmE [Bacteroidales bacterium]